ncbi:MAG: SDR family oxidoreductase [Bacteroidota bacterium]|nr:SDR family oxidoreductase [Bacteroidota bacterium]
MQTILITGGTGFIGSNLAASLVSQGYHVKILRRKLSSTQLVDHLDIEHCTGDVRDNASLHAAMKDCDTVFHTAAVVSFWKSLRQMQYDVNVIGTKNVAQACLETGVKRLVYTSSIAALGHPTSGALADESTPFNWKHLHSGYKASKHLAEIEIESAVDRGLDAVMINPTVIIGPGDIHFHGGSIIRSVQRGLVPFYIKGGMNVVYVDDVVNVHVDAAEKGRTGERYIAGGENLTHKQIFQTTAEILGKRPPRLKIPVPLLKLAAGGFDIAASILRTQPLISTELISGAGLYNWYSSAKAERELGYRPTPFREAVEKTCQWYREHKLL